VSSKTVLIFEIVELNFIERYWGRLKWFCREHCDYTIANLWKAADMGMSAENCDLTLLRKYARTSWRWMSAYETGLSGPQAAFAVKKFRGHRGVTVRADEAVFSS
jgi:hypothetical protein